MIVAERKRKEEVDILEEFGENLLDGRLTAPSNVKEYRLRDAIMLSKQLGRPLSEEEMKHFEI